jgi:site-specific DNA-methyltransferase (cytosine-N4-specific)
VGKIIFKNSNGVSYCGDSLQIIKSKSFQSKYKGKVNLILTSPPFSLVSKKKYGNESGENYIKWLKDFAKPLSELLTEDGIVLYLIQFFIHNQNELSL